MLQIAAFLAIWPPGSGASLHCKILVEKLTGFAYVNSPKGVRKSREYIEEIRRQPQTTGPEWKADHERCNLLDPLQLPQLRAFGSYCSSGTKKKFGAYQRETPIDIFLLDLSSFSVQHSKEQPDAERDMQKEFDSFPNKDMRVLEVITTSLQHWHSWFQHNVWKQWTSIWASHCYLADGSWREFCW